MIEDVIIALQAISVELTIQQPAINEPHFVSHQICEQNPNIMINTYNDNGINEDHNDSSYLDRTAQPNTATPPVIDTTQTPIGVVDQTPFDLETNLDKKQTTFGDIMGHYDFVYGNDPIDGSLETEHSGGEDEAHENEEYEGSECSECNEIEDTRVHEIMSQASKIWQQLSSSLIKSHASKNPPENIEVADENEYWLDDIDSEDENCIKSDLQLKNELVNIERLNFIMDTLENTENADLHMSTILTKAIDEEIERRVGNSKTEIAKKEKKGF
ncbi:hypothetical protein EIN_028080 [Entamoeba invadens IP1]|uniref:Uncharacterized protein n=1 Tax=Entamoeba invadens IP1 TaxID=370355 RepID=L7FNZ5_ENTIV|nr:hypothetical protein EIN_028080 [Entamoeba invadens IP1]ELP93615.1 hypothetical protein EIN_028080 [Entamoeba invadens IP1]|eukprot:XP_004260386.1 hypothetical protein EIN_028080 [Entamoeba invadens IP1]